KVRVLEKQSGISDADLDRISKALAIGALRYFLLKFTRNTIIAFDFEDALKTEGETGPYCQYAVVRARSIWRKGAYRDPDLTSDKTIAEAVALLGATSGQERGSVVRILEESENADIWPLLLHAGSLDYAVDAAIGTQEPNFVAKYAFQLAQSFNNFYHKHHILSESDEHKRAF